MAATYDYDQWIMGQEVNIAQNAVAHLKTMLPDCCILADTAGFAEIVSCR